MTHAVDWTAITALATAASALVVAVTVIVAVHQLRLTSVQLDQLRKATQLEGSMKVFDDLHGSTYTQARRFVATELPDKLRDPLFRAEIALGLIWTTNPDEIHEELFVLRTFETIGSHIRHGLLDEQAVLDSIALSVLSAWQHLGDVIELQRQTIHPRVWENFEYLNTLATQWFLERGGPERLKSWTERVNQPESRAGLDAPGAP